MGDWITNKLKKNVKNKKLCPNCGEWTGYTWYNKSEICRNCGQDNSKEFIYSEELKIPSN